ncbi:outer membrane beta-barrel protein [Roseibium sp. MMSF_3544]|uniref:outer membrane beta-barrel protein n=1 Tax=unclassified Roseibium TaxID=2629323 RepID=UPI0027402486|nr:outer membrane beta-barrel protein [Roseibium sp. MMSF_3544]
MRRILHLIVSLAVLQAVPSLAQTTLSDLRGSSDADGALGSEPAADTAVESEDTNPTQANVYALRRTLNASEAETGSSGLGTNGQVGPIRPFSDRIAAVDRAVPLAGSLIDDSVFGGDTTFDEPQGIRLGSFTFTPQITFSAGYTDNTAQSADGTSGSLYRISPDLSLVSNWSRHQFDASLRGTYTGYPENSDDNDGNISAAANLRLDVSEATQVDTGVSYTYSREEDGSAESTSSGVDHIQNLTADLGATRSVGLIAATAALGADRSVYTSDDDIDSGRDNTVYSATLRFDANTGSVLTPFVEGSLLLRRFDESCSDDICEKRDANGYQLRGGLTIASGPKVTGNVGIGWRIEDIEDDRLDSLSGLVLDGSLVWSPSRLTTVTAGLGTNFQATDIDTASGSIIYSGDLRVAHAFSDRLVGETGVGYSYRTYEGVSIEEQTLTGFGGVTFALTNSVALTADYTHRRFDSSQEGSDYTENAIEAGLRFRH